MRYVAILFLCALAYIVPSANAAPADTTKTAANADSVRMRREIITILHELGVKTSEDSVEAVETADTSAAPNKKIHEHRKGFELSIGKFIFPPHDPGPYFDWQKFSGFRYNRVDGLFLGLGSSTPHLVRSYKNYVMYNEFMDDDSASNARIAEKIKDDTLAPDDWRVTEGLGYAFGSHFWTIEGSIAHVFYLGDRERGAMLNALEIGAEGHIRTDTRDAWLLDADENTLTSLVAREDYQDYFKRQGFSINGTWHIGDEHLMLSYRDDRFNNLIERDYWTFFGGNKVFRPNPPVTEGVIPSAVIETYLNTKPEYRNRGWVVLGEAEFGTGDYKFDRFILDVRRYQPLTHWMEFNIRARASAVTGNIPMQDSVYVGGISTLPAYDYKEFTGNRALLVNAEWGFGANVFDWALDRSMIFLLGDAGYAYTATGAVSDGWSNISIPNMHTDLGIAYGTKNDGFRIGVLWRNDRNDGAKFFIRFSRPF
ncbi:MAG TPA: hypothetical protein VFJ29_06540 [Candidatus Kapabacteria bacterium]|nr:hypothetical protein [Candidatus Kapabacteria bacterium]